MKVSRITSDISYNSDSGTFEIHMECHMVGAKNAHHKIVIPKDMNIIPHVDYMLKHQQMAVKDKLVEMANDLDSAIED